MKKPHEMTFAEYSKRSKDFYDKHGNDAWLQSIYHANVTQETHNECIKLGISTLGTFYRQHKKSYANNKT